jgi:RNA polymerase sigma-70 factor (ECF subfamily)
VRDETPPTDRPGDVPLLAEVLEARRPALLAFIERRLGPALRGKIEPQDVAQEVAVRALREPAAGEGDPFAWLCRLAEQCIVDGHRHFAAGKRDTGREVPGNVPAGEDGLDLVALLTASMTTPSLAAVRSERQQQLNAAVATLPEEQREALRLRYGEGLATRDIAARLGKTDVAVRVLLSRTLQRLRELLDPGDAISG